MSHGARIFRDIRVPYGPLSLWVLHGASWIFGLRVATVAAVEFAAGLGAALLLVRFSARFLGPPARLAAAALLVAGVFWIPGEGSLLYSYAPAVPIGVFLALAALLLGCRRERARSLAFAAAAGCVAGLAYLCKQETGAAAALGLAAAWLARDGFRAGMRKGLLGAAAFLATAAGGYALAFRSLPFLRLARLSLLWPFASMPEAWRRQYSAVTGSDHPVAAAAAAAAATAAIVAGVSAGVTIWGLVRRRAKIGPRALLLMVAGAAVMAAAGGLRGVSPFSAAPVACAAALAAGWAGRNGPDGSANVALAALSAASLPLLTRVGWRGWADSPFAAIGYTLALPVLVWGARFVCLRLLRGDEVESTAFLRAAGPIAAAGILLAGVPALAGIGREPEPATAFRSPRGTVWVAPAWAETFRAVRAAVRERTGSFSLVLFLPESHGLNFLLERDGPLPGAKLDPAFTGEVESDAIERLEKAPPGLIVEFEEDHLPFATEGFGREWGRALEAWIRERYTVIVESSGRGIPYRVLVPKRGGGVGIVSAP